MPTILSCWTNAAHLRCASLMPLPSPAGSHLGGRRVPENGVAPRGVVEALPGWLGQQSRRGTARCRQRPGKGRINALPFDLAAVQGVLRWQPSSQPQPSAKSARRHRAGLSPAPTARSLSVSRNSFIACTAGMFVETAVCGDSFCTQSRSAAQAAPQSGSISVRTEALPATAWHDPDRRLTALLVMRWPRAGSALTAALTAASAAGRGGGE